MKYYCNPVNINYRYQFNQDPRLKGKIQTDREAADPSMILFKGRYYIFASMTLGVWVSDDLVNWENHRLPDDMPLYDYAPDVRVRGDYVYFCASARDHICDRYRTKDILNGPYEKIPGTFSYWDPNLFFDDDGRVYFYWGCTNVDPIWGVELDPETFVPKGEKVACLSGDPLTKGYERVGEDGARMPRSEQEVDAMVEGFLKAQGQKADQIPKALLPMIRGMFTNQPYIEGAWMTKHDGKYYLQYACTGAEYNVYADGVYVSDRPLGPFVLAGNNPYSYKPGGFLPGAGHGSTMEDRSGNFWHTATMRISVNHSFERRVGIWPAAFEDGELVCDQRYGDWPARMLEDGEKSVLWQDPEWMLLSFGKKVTASSVEKGETLSKNGNTNPENAVDENVQTWWRAATNQKGEWIQVDLGEPMDVRAVQVNFADDGISIPVPGKIRGTTQARFIDPAPHVTRWELLGSLDGETFTVIEDKSQVSTDLTHDLVVRENGIKVRYVRLVVDEVAYQLAPCVSGLRIFGHGNGTAPQKASFTATRLNDGIDMDVTAQAEGAIGYNILFGADAQHLTHSYLVFAGNGRGSSVTKRVAALVKGRGAAARVDAINENGITHGDPITL